MAGDFELLAAYIALKTKGLGKVLGDFARVRTAAKQLSDAPLAVNMGRAASHSSRFAAFTRSAQIQLTRLSRNTLSTAEHTARLDKLQASLQARLAAGNLSQGRRLQLERLITQTSRQRQSVLNREATSQQRAARAQEQIARNRARIEAYLQRVRFNSIAAEQRRQASLARIEESNRKYLQRVRLNSDKLEERRLSRIARAQQNTQQYLQRVRFNSIAMEQRRQRQLEREATNRAIRQRQLLNSVSLEVGFIAPFARLGTNLFRISGSFKELARNAGLGATAIRLAGIAGSVFGATLVAMQAAVSVMSRLFSAFASVALQAVAIGFRTLFGPTLAFIGLVNRLLANLPILAGVLGGVLGRQLTDVAQRMQRITSTFSFAFGAQSQAELQRIIALSNRLGVPLEEIARQYARITVAARDSGLSQRSLQRLIEGVSSASVALGLDVENVNGILFAFEQIISKGRLASEELRRQLGDRLPGAFQIAARALGVTTAELDKLLEQGAIDAKVFVAAIGDELLKTFGVQAQGQVGRITASIQRFRNQLFLVQGEMAGRLEPAIVAVIARFTEMIKQVRNTQAFGAFISFVDRNLTFLANNMRRIASAVAGYLRDIAPTIQRLTRLVIVLNTVAIGSLLQLLRRTVGVVDEVVAKFEAFTSKLTGISFNQVEVGLRAVLVIINNMPLILEIIRLRLRIIVLVVQGWLELFREMFRLSFALLKGIPILGEAVISIQKALATSTDTATKLANIEREIAIITAELQQKMEAAFSIDRMEAFGAAVVRVFGRMRQRMLESTGVWIDFSAGVAGTIASILEAVGALNGEAKKSLDLTGGGKGAGKSGSHSIVPIAELRNTIENSLGKSSQQSIARSSAGTERNTSSIASAVSSLDQKLSQLPSVIDAAVRAAILGLPGGGLSR